MKHCIACSGNEGEGSHGNKKKEKTKQKRRKTQDKIPRLTILNITDETMIECQLETAKQRTVTFTFDTDTDKPKEIAENLVSAFSFQGLA